MKLYHKILKLSLLTASYLILNSCDSGGIADEQPGDIATSNQTANIGDIFTFNSSRGVQGLIDEFIINSPNVSGTSATSIYSYQKNGNTSATISLTRNTQPKLTSSLELILTGAFGAELSNELRLLLSEFTVPNGVFTAAQIDRIVTILNNTGVELIINPNDPTQILAADQLIYNLKVDSTVLEKFRGTISGIYNIVGPSNIVKFEASILPGGQDNTELYIPFVSTELTDELELDSGRWTQQLENVNNLP